MAIAARYVTVLDCPDPKQLADFYGEVLGWSVRGEAGDQWVEVCGPDGHRLAFQESPGYRPPHWPSVESPQQFHLDLYVERERMDEAEREVTAIGARLVQSDDEERTFRVYLDPVGHPFCFCPC